MNIDKIYEVTENEISNLPLYEKQRITIDLLTQLATVLNEKNKLERENSDLKVDKHKLIQKYLDLERSVGLEKKSWTKDVLDSQLRVQEKDTILAKKDVERLEEQKLSLLEINNLKLSFYEQRDAYEAIQMELGSKIKSLQDQIRYIDIVYNDLKTNVEIKYKKYTVYKKKVKYAVAAITELMQEVKKYKRPLPMMVHEACQTEGLINESLSPANLDVCHRFCKMCLANSLSYK